MVLEESTLVKTNARCENCSEPLDRVAIKKGYVIGVCEYVRPGPEGVAVYLDVQRTMRWKNGPIYTHVNGDIEVLDPPEIKELRITWSEYKAMGPEFSVHEKVCEGYRVYILDDDTGAVMLYSGPSSPEGYTE